MLASPDYVGIATLVGAFGAALTSLLVAWWNRPARSQAVQQQVDEIHAAVSTPEGTPTLGVTAAETKAAVNGFGTTPPTGTPEVHP